MKIVVVDDDRFQTALVRDVLRERFPDANILTFQNPILALSELTENEVDLLITDIEMPEMTGLTLASLVKERQPGVKIIIMTGLILKDNVTAPHDAFMRKPFHQGLFYSLIDTVLHGQV